MSGMEMSSMDMTSATPTSMASMTMSMASPTATSSDMAGMDMGGGSSSMMMGMSDMMMVFFTSTSTPLYSSAWTPKSTGQYAGTCIFIIALAFVMRALVALRVNFLGIWDNWSWKHGPDAFFDKPGGCAPACQGPRPWRINESAVRACLDVVLAGVSYLL